MPERYAFVDAAKLISWTVLTLAAFRPGPETGKRVTRRIDVFAADRMKGLPVKARCTGCKTVDPACRLPALELTV